MSSGAVIIWALLVLAALMRTDAIDVIVDTNAEECFAEKIDAGTKFYVWFEVVEGGFFDVNIKVTGPDGTTIYEMNNALSGDHAFTATASGKHQVCFNNERRSVTPKLVRFFIDVGVSSRRQLGASAIGEIAKC